MRTLSPEPRRPRILFITSRADYGGGPQHVYSLLQEVTKEFDVSVACPAEAPFWERFQEHAACFEIPHRQFRWNSLLGLARLVRERQIDLIHSHGKGAGVYSRLLAHFIPGPKIIHSFHGIHYRLQRPARRFLELSLERYFSRFTSSYIHVSASEKAEAERLGLYGTRPVSVIPNGVPVPAQRPPKTLGNKLTLINISRLAPEKNVETVLLIAQTLRRELKDFRLQIVGDGPDRDQLEKTAQAAGLSDVTEFLGFRRDVPELLRAAGIYLTASHGEALPLTILEAMAAGTPVVASEVMGHTDAVEHGVTGLLFPLSNPPAAAAAILSIHRSRDLFEQISAAAFDRARKEFSTEQMTRRTSELYARLLGRP